MIDSTIFSKSVFRNESMVLVDDFKQDNIESSRKVNRSVLYHFYHAYINSIYQDNVLSKIQKVRSCQEFGFSIGYNFAQQQSQGFIKNFIQKANDKNAKPYIAEMKLLYTKIWTVIFDSSAKLFAILSETASYKLQDKQFTFTKSLSTTNQLQLKSYKTLVYEFSKGIIQGFLDKFLLKAQISYNQISQNSIYFEIKDISKKQR